MIGDKSPKRFSSSYRATLSSQCTLPAMAANADLERLLIEKTLNQERLLRELTYKEQTLQLFQSEKNLKMDQYQLQVEEEMLKLKRKFEVESDGLNRRALELQRQLRESSGRQRELEFSNANLLKQIEMLEKESIRSKEDRRALHDHIEKLTDALKLAEIEELQLKQKNADMQQEIMVLLQIQTGKSKQIALLEENQRSLQQKYLTLQTALTELQSHIKLLTQKIQNRDSACEQMKSIIGNMDAEIQGKELALVNYQRQLQEAVRKQKIRETQVNELMAQNERLYVQLTREKHRLRDLAMEYKFVV